MTKNPVINEKLIADNNIQKGRRNDIVWLTMVDLYFGEISSSDLLMAVLTGLAGAIVLAVAYKLTENGHERWKARKLVHISMGTVIGLTVVGYSNLSGPTLATGIFVTVLIYAWAHKSSLVSELLLAGSRENETSTNTFASGFMGLVSFALSFIVFLPRPEIFVSAILSVSWADGAGEVFGRTLGTRFFKTKYRTKTVEGSIGVFLFAIFSMIAALVTYSSLSPSSMVLQILIIASLVALTELFSTGWMDNFFIPLVMATSMWILIFPTMPLFGLFPVF